MGGARAAEEDGFPEQLKVVTKSRAGKRGEPSVVLRWNKYAILHRRARLRAILQTFDAKKLRNERAIVEKSVQRREIRAKLKGLTTESRNVPNT